MAATSPGPRLARAYSLYKPIDWGYPIPVKKMEVDAMVPQQLAFHESMEVHELTIIYPKAPFH